MIMDNNFSLVCTATDIVSTMDRLFLLLPPTFFVFSSWVGFLDSRHSFLLSGYLSAKIQICYFICSPVSHLPSFISFCSGTHPCERRIPGYFYDLSLLITFHHHSLKRLLQTPSYWYTSFSSFTFVLLSTLPLQVIPKYVKQYIL